MIAIEKNHIDIVKTLIAHGADNPYQLQTKSQMMKVFGKINPEIFLVLREYRGNPDAFNEVVRRIRKDILDQINQTLTEVTPAQLEQLNQVLKDPNQLFYPSSLIHDAMFPVVTLKSLALNEITPHEFGTLTRLWGSLPDILPKHGDVSSLPQFIPLLLSNGKPNPRAELLLSQSLSSEKLKKHGVVLRIEQIIKSIMTRAHSLSPYEQGFWLVADATDTVRYQARPEIENTRNKEEKKSLMASQTITQRIKELGVVFLHYTNDTEHEMIPT